MKFIPRLNPSPKAALSQYVTLWLAAVAMLITLGACSLNSPAKVAHGDLGQKVKVENVSYTVLDADWTEALGEGANARIPSHRFLLRRISATNEGGEAAQMGSFKLIGADGTEYDELANGSGVTEWLGMTRQIDAKASRQGLVLFDVPKAVYQLQVADEFYDGDHGSAALIRIPLRPTGVEPVVSGTLP
ncbi:MAG: DUF4352 domain-containing protein [Bryobacterales bacterium]|nr:DUF4352 domain-containing protein [Bryobacterales bacterium]